METIKTAFNLDYPKGENRIDLYDFLRGVAMIIVMIQHAGFPGSQYLLTFHMPLFFFLSGMVVGGRELPSFGKYAWSKFKRLMIPYYVFGFLTILINWIYLSVAGEEYSVLLAALGIITGMYGFVPDAYSGIYWFLLVMFMADMMVYPINKYLKNSIAAKVGGAILFLILSYIANHFYPMPIFTIDKAFMGASFILLGELCKPLTKYLNVCKFIWYDGAFILCALFGVLFSERMNTEPVLMYLNKYGNYGWFLLGALSGIVLVILVSKNIYEWLSMNKRVFYKFIMWIGFNSLVMFPIHLMIKTYMSELVYIGTGSCVLRLLLMFIVGIPVCNIITNYFPWILGMTNKKVVR